MPQISIDFTQPISLFPLPNCVLLPHATIPLHIFEPRYRAMTNDALDSRGLIAMACFDGNTWKRDYQGAPPIRPHVCVGYLVRHERLTDGRYNILLQGVCRARIVDELPHDPYRIARLEPIEQPAGMEMDLEQQRACIESLLSDPLLKSLASVSAIHNWLDKEIPTAALVDLSVMTVCDDTEHRYEMLREPDPGLRAQWLCGYLTRTRQTLATAKRFGNGKTDEGYGLN